MSQSSLPTGWKMVELGQHCRVQNGFPFKSVFFDAHEGTPLVRVRSLKAQSCDIRYRGSYDPTFAIQDGDILIGMDGDFQPCWWQNGKALLNQRVCRLIDFTSDVEPFFIFQALKEPLRRIENVTHFTTVKHLSASQIRSIEIPLPPLPEQRAIASTLKAVQDAKEARRREMELERERKAALMQHLFTYGTRGEPLKDTEIVKIPQSWEVVKLGESCKLRGETTAREANMPYLGLEHIDGGTSRAARYGKSSDVVSSKSMFFPGDVLYGKLRPYLDKCVLAEVQGVATTELLVIVANVDLDAEFLLNLMHTQRFVNYAITNTGGTNLPRVRWSELAKFDLPLPPLKEQHEIAAILRACDDKIAALERESKYFDELFRALLEELMSGRLRAMRPASQSTS